jgi:hypothetical protein
VGQGKIRPQVSVVMNFQQVEETVEQYDPQGSVVKSTDGGASWELIHYRQLTSSTRVNPVWHPTDPDTAFAAGGWGGSSTTC